MTGLTRTLARTAAASIVALSVVAPAEGASILLDNANPQNIPGLTGFVTSGAMMNGMSVTAHFNNGSFETEFWGATGAMAGGVTGTGWSLSVDGDTFTSSWNFVNDGAGKLERLVLDGSSGLTVFDKREPDFGTDGSFSGLDFASSLSQDSLVVATYRNPVGVGGAGGVGDLFQILDLNFKGLQTNGTRESFTFVQDADNDSRLASVDNQVASVPEPTMLALFGLGLLGTMRARRNARR